jgi:hypothetical protein
MRISRFGSSLAGRHRLEAAGGVFEHGFDLLALDPKHEVELPRYW